MTQETKPDVVVMPTIRMDLMDAIGRYRDYNRENALSQVKTTSEGLSDAMRYFHRADAADGLAMVIHNVLQKHDL